MSKTGIRISYLIRKDKQDRNGEVPVFMRVTINKQSTTVNLSLRVPPSRWNSKGFLTGRSEEVEKVNTYLAQCKLRIQDIYRQTQVQGKKVSLQGIKSEYLGKTVAKVSTLVEAFEDHNAEMQALTGVKYSPWTIKHYKTTLRYINQYLQQVCRKQDIPLYDLDYSFATNFEKYLLTHTPCAKNGAMKHIQRLKKITNRALKMGWLDKNPFHAFKVSYKRTERGYLSLSEVQLLQSTTLPERLQKVRDVFVFQIYTGLAYCDVKALQPSHITPGIDGSEWIFLARQKTGVKSMVPLLEKAKRILEAYAGEEYCLPVISNQKMNKGLKEIASLCDIEKRLTTHLARHTFATTITLSNGVPIETVSKMLGHTQLATTQIYSKIVEQKIADDMSKLKQTLQ